MRRACAAPSPMMPRTPPASCSGLPTACRRTLVSSIVTAVGYRLAVFGTKGCAELLTPELDFHFTPTPDCDAGRAPRPAHARGDRAPRVQRAFSPSLKRSPQRSRAARPTRSRPSRCCTASPRSRRSSARRRPTNRSRSRATEVQTRGTPMPVTVLYPEARQQPDHLETEVFGPDLRIVKRDTGALSELVRRRLRRGRRADDHGVRGHRRRSRALSRGCARSSAWGSATTSSTAPPPRRATSSSATSPITARPRSPIMRSRWR